MSVQDGYPLGLPAIAGQITELSRQIDAAMVPPEWIQRLGRSEEGRREQKEWWHRQFLATTELRRMRDHLIRLEARRLSIERPNWLFVDGLGKQERQT